METTINLEEGGIRLIIEDICWKNLGSFSHLVDVLTERTKGLKVYASRDIISTTEWERALLSPVKFSVECVLGVSDPAMIGVPINELYLKLDYLQMADLVRGSISDLFTGRSFLNALRKHHDKSFLCKRDFESLSCDKDFSKFDKITKLSFIQKTGQIIKGTVVNKNIVSYRHYDLNFYDKMELSIESEHGEEYILDKSAFLQYEHYYTNRGLIAIDND